MSNIVSCPSCGKRNRVPAASSGLPQCASCGAKLPWLVAGTDADFAEAVDARVPVLIDLWAPWCAPCRAVAPILEKVALERAGKLKVVKVDVDENPLVQARFNAMSIPTMVLWKQGREVARQVGARQKQALDRWLDQG